MGKATMNSSIGGVLSIVLLLTTQPAPAAEEEAPRDLGDGKRLVVSVADTPAPPLTPEQKERDQEWIRSQPPGSSVHHPRSYRTFGFAVATADGAAPQPAWSLKTAVFEGFSDRFQLLDAALVDGDTLVLVFHQGFQNPVQVHAVDLKPEAGRAAFPQEPLVVVIADEPGLHVTTAKVRGSLRQGTFKVVMTGWRPGVNEKKVAAESNELPEIGSASLRLADKAWSWALTWVDPPRSRPATRPGDTQPPPPDAPPEQARW